MGHRGAVEALEVLSGSQKEEDGEHHSQVEALEEEEALAYREAQVDLREKDGHKTFAFDYMHLQSKKTKQHFSILNMTQRLSSSLAQFVTYQDHYFHISFG